jgi:hypothetical protein
MPARVDDMEISALMNTEEAGIAPVVDGHVVDVRPYLREFKEGYHVAYTRAVEQRGEIQKALGSLDPDTTVRVVLRPTRGYVKMLQKLYHHTALESKGAREHNLETLGRMLHEFDATMEDAQQVGLDEVARVIGNGSDVAGTVPSLVNEETQAALRDSDLVISKGLANYETLSGRGDNICFLFLCKCQLYVDLFGVPLHTGLVVRGV